MKYEKNKNIEVYQQKIDRMKDITFNKSYIIDVDAEQPYEDELLLLKRTIWNLLTNIPNTK